MKNIEGYVHNLLNVYGDDAKFLQSFRLENAVGHAGFRVQSEFYSSFKEIMHLTAVQMQICINQMLFIYVSALGKYNKLFAGHEQDMAYINDFQNKNTFITSQVYHFHKKIDSGKLINARIWLKKEKMIRDLLVMYLKFDFENQSVTGEVKVAIKVK